MYKYYKYKNFYLIGIFLCFLVLLLVFSKTLEIRIDTIDYAKINSYIKDNQYSLVHVGEINETNKKIMSNMKTNFGAEIYNVISVSELDENVEYLAYIKETLVGTIEKDKTEEEIETYLKKYYLNIIPDDEKVYIEAESYNEIATVTSKNELSIIVFGALDCSYCSLYQPVMNDVATKYNLDIYYIEKNVMEDSEYESIRNMDFEVPAKCTTTNEATSTSKSIATPLTLIVKKNKTVDCILGYVTEEELTEVLKDNKLIK